MLFDYCRAQSDVGNTEAVLVDLPVLNKGRVKKGKGKGKTSKDLDAQDEKPEKTKEGKRQGQ